MIQKLFTLPSINDITTDLDDPPTFATLNIPPYPKEFATKQKTGYPDLAPVIVAQEPDAVFDRALALAGTNGWTIAARGREAGLIEATATTALLGFNDDVAIRIRPDDKGSRIDMRSRSRIGRHDLGANANRIRAFLDTIKK